MTFICAVVVVIYALANMLNIASLRGAKISQYLSQADSSEQNPTELSSRNFQIAVAFEGTEDGQFKNDAGYVRYIFRVSGKRNNQWYEKLIHHHVCTAEDYAKFYPI